MRTWVKRIGYAVGGLVVLIVVAAATVYAMSESRWDDSSRST